MPRKKTQQEFLEQAKAVHGDLYDYSEVVYSGSGAKVLLVCVGCANEFSQSAKNHLAGQGCPVCNTGSKAKTNTTQEFIAKAMSVHGSKYDYSETVYTGTKDRVSLTCRSCSRTFEQRASSHLAGQGCIKCRRHSRQKTHEQFLSEAYEVHGDLYDYSETSYSSSEKKVLLKCNRCEHKFEQLAGNHLKGQGCAPCSWDSYRLGRDKFIQKALEVHKPGLFDYTKVSYRSLQDPVVLTCNLCCFVFKQAPNNHLKGRGCPECAKVERRLTTEKFVEAAQEVHGNLYDYGKTEYVRAIEKIAISCPAHGEFEQAPYSHLNGNGCPRCSKHSRISKAETEWLDHLGVPERQYRIDLPSGRTARVDGYDPETNTVYEYLGSFWHADPRLCPPEETHTVIGKLNKDIHQQTLDRLEELRSAGYKVVFVWGYDWTSKQ